MNLLDLLAIRYIIIDVRGGCQPITSRVQKGRMMTNRILANTDLTRVQALGDVAITKYVAPPTLSLSRCFVLCED